MQKTDSYHASMGRLKKYHSQNFECRILQDTVDEVLGKTAVEVPYFRFLYIHSKSEEVCGFYFSVSQNLPKIVHLENFTFQLTIHIGEHIENILCREKYKYEVCHCHCGILIFSDLRRMCKVSAQYAQYSQTSNTTHVSSIVITSVLGRIKFIYRSLVLLKMQTFLARIFVLLAMLAPSSALLPCAQVPRNTDKCVII